MKSHFFFLRKHEESFKLNISKFYIYIVYTLFRAQWFFFFFFLRNHFELNVENSLQEKFGHEIPFGVRVQQYPRQTFDPHLVVFLFLIFQKIIAQH